MKRYLADLDYDWSEFTLDDFMEWLTNSLGEPVILVPCYLPSDICGAYIISPSGHLILFDQNLPPLLRLHTILHEIAHLLCGHQTASLSHDEIENLDWVMANSDIFVPKLAMTRNPSSKTNRQEQEAEALALLIQSEVQKAKNFHQLMQPAVYTELAPYWG